ncbi:MAG: EamA family transporter, partial [Rectinema sp.]
MKESPVPRLGWARGMPILAVLVAAALGASSGLYIKGLAFSSLAMTSLRMTVPLLLVLPSAAKHGLLLGKRGMRWQLFLASALNAIRLYLYVLAYKLTSMGNAVVLLYLWPVFALVIGGIIFLPFLIAEIPHAPLSHLSIGIFYGVAVGLVGFGLFFVGMKRLPLFQYSA